MTEAERSSLRAQVRAELRLAAQGRYSTDARSAIEQQGRFLLAVLEGRAAMPPVPPSKRPRSQSAEKSPKEPATVRLRAVRTYSPSPSKYLLPAYGAPVSGGLPSLGQRS